MLKTAYAELNMKKLDECKKRVSIAMQEFNVSEVPSCFPSLAFAQPPNFSSFSSQIISKTPPAYKKLNLANKTFNLANKAFNLAKKTFNLARRRRTILCKT